MFRYLNTLRISSQLMSDANRMLEEGAFPWSASVGPLITSQMVKKLVWSHQEQLVNSWPRLERLYPQPLVRIAGLVQVCACALQSKSELQDLAEELLLVSAIALHEITDSRLLEAAHSLTAEIDSVALRYAPELYKDMRPIELASEVYSTRSSD